MIRCFSQAPIQLNEQKFIYHDYQPQNSFCYPALFMNNWDFILTLCMAFLFSG